MKVVQGLVEIRKRFGASHNGLALSVDSAGGQWTASVVDPAAGKILYTARRGEAGSAKAAAVDFALAWKSALATEGLAERVANQLHWTESW